MLWMQNPGISGREEVGFAGWSQSQRYAQLGNSPEWRFILPPTPGTRRIAPDSLRGGLRIDPCGSRGRNVGRLCRPHSFLSFTSGGRGSSRSLKGRVSAAKNLMKGGGVAMTCRLRPLSRQEVRELDVRAAEQLGLPTLILMENAGRGAAAWLVELAAGVRTESAARPFSAPPSTEIELSPAAALPRVLILSGPGNNGGDGGVVARHLDAWGFAVRIVWFANREQLRGDAKTQWMILERSGVDQTAWFPSQSDDPRPAELDSLIAEADWLVDGLLGTGLTRPVEGALRTVIEVMNRSNKPILALDVPSGLDADTGMPLGTAIRAARRPRSPLPSSDLPLLVPLLSRARSPLSTSACRAHYSSNSWFEILRRHGRRSQIPTRRASEGKACRPSLARRVGIRPRADLPRRGNKKGPISTQYFGTNWARSAYLGLWCHSLSLTLKPRSRVSWAKSAHGVLGCLAMTSSSNRLASTYFWAVRFLAASGSLA